jgi:hypothetical protein
MQVFGQRLKQLVFEAIDRNRPLQTLIRCIRKYLRELKK